MNKSEKKFPAGKIRFEIEALGPIRDSVINFKPFLLFSGESNTGKSYAAIAVYYLFFMLNNEKTMTELTSKLFNIKKIEKDLKTKKEIEVDLPVSLSEGLEKLYNYNINRFMAYMLGHDDFSCGMKLKLEIPPPLNAKIRITQPKGEGTSIEARLTASFPQMNSGIIGGTVRRSVLTTEGTLGYLVGNLCRMLVLDEMDCREFFLPPARGTFSGLTSSIWKKFSGIGMYNEFVEGIDSVRFTDFETYEAIEEQRNFVNPLFEKLLNGKINLEKDSVSYTITGSDEQMPLTAGSSSVKELFPLYLLLNRVPIYRLSICIEEPEAHLHPELQRSTALLLSYIVNQGGFIQTTTHSDFFVNKVNNLLKLHFIKNKDPNRFKKILKENGTREESVLNPEDIGAYYFEKIKDYVQARKLEVSENGMTLDSFKRAYEQSVKETRNLREALADHEE